jgi:hypothetical protein
MDEREQAQTQIQAHAKYEERGRRGGRRKEIGTTESGWGWVQMDAGEGKSRCGRV